MSIIPHCSFYQAHFLLTNMSLSTVLHTQIINHCTLSLSREPLFGWKLWKNFKIKTEVSCIILICDIVHYMQPHPLPSYPQNYLVLLSTYKLNTFENI